MAYPNTTFPTTLDAPSNPIATSLVATFDHAGLESFQNNAIKALETKLGVDSSAVTTTVDYKLSTIPATDKAVSKTGTETLTNKTLTSPILTTPALGTPASGVGTNLTGIPEGALALTDITTANVSASAHGFAPKFPNNTTTFLRGDGTYAVPSIAGTTVKTFIPMPVGSFSGQNGQVSTGMSGNTTAWVGKINFPASITVNYVSIETATVSVSGTWIISLFSEDGATRLFSVTTGTLSTNTTPYTTAVSSVVVASGNYYLMIQPISTSSSGIYCWYQAGLPLAATGSLNDIAHNGLLYGTYSVTANTAPTTITPTSITGTISSTIFARFDN